MDQEDLGEKTNKMTDDRRDPGLKKEDWQISPRRETCRQMDSSIIAGFQKTE